METFLTPVRDFDINYKQFSMAADDCENVWVFIWNKHLLAKRVCKRGK